MKNNNPQVRLIFSWLLYYGESQDIAKAKGISIDITAEECEAKTKLYREAWQPNSELLLTEMQQVFELRFYKNIIDAYLAPLMPPKSHPLLLHFKREPDLFIDILTHELLHILFNDNQYVKADQDKNVIDKLTKLFGERDRRELVHIPVHAGLKYLYLDVLNEPYRLERDIERCNEWPSYKAAWDYVEQNDYKEIINAFKKSYSEL